jgi:hypothetical protein
MWRVSLLLSILLSAAAAAEEPARSDLFAQQPGRYQIVVSQHGQRDTFLLDTGSGRVWRLVHFTDVEEQPTAWQEMPRMGPGDSMRAIMARFGWKLKEEMKPGPNPKLGPQAPARPPQ